MLRSSYNWRIARAGTGKIQPAMSTKSLGLSWRSFPSAYLYFDGVDDRVDLPNTSPIFGANDDITLDFWINPYVTTDFQRVICQKATSTDDMTLLLVDNNVCVFDNGGVNRMAGAKHITSTGWFHCAARRASGAWRIFKNGVETSFISGSGAGVSSRNTIGCRYTTRYGGFFNGKLWNLRIWDRALSQFEIAKWMNMDPKPNRSDLLLWLPMNEGSGTTLTDATGNGWTGAITGCTWV